MDSGEDLLDQLDELPAYLRNSIFEFVRVSSKPVSSSEDLTNALMASVDVQRAIMAERH